jgi:hypothetical protein
VRKLTVRTVRRKVKVRGYVDLEEQRVQQLGYKTILGFKVLDEEIVPSHVDISLGCFGDTGSDWQSKFVNWIPAKRGGKAELFE